MFRLAPTAKIIIGIVAAAGIAAAGYFGYQNFIAKKNINPLSINQQKQFTGTLDNSAEKAAPNKTAGEKSAPQISLRCVGVEHHGSSSTVKVCVNLKNISTKEKLGDKLKFAMILPDSRDPDATSAYINPEKPCATFKINKYGAYSGSVGISTEAGAAMVDWDINVTSTPQECKQIAIALIKPLMKNTKLRKL